MYTKYSICTTVCVTGFDTYTQSSHNSFDVSKTNRSVCFRAIVSQKQRLSQMIQNQALTDCLNLIEREEDLTEERALLVLASAHYALVCGGNA